MTIAGMNEGLVEGAFGFAPQAYLRLMQLRLRTARWKFLQICRRRKAGGYKFSEQYLGHAWRPIIPLLSGVDLISNFQLVPESLLRSLDELDIRLNFYIDGTLSEYFDSYSKFEVSGVGEVNVADAVARERRCYQRANAVFTMSQPSADVLVHQYGLARENVHVVLPGANLDETTVGLTPSDLPRWPFILCFVGIYPERKGIDRLVRAVELLRDEGLDVRVRVIGDAPEIVRRSEAVDYMGRIDKRYSADYFVQQISTAHFGCLLSQAELAGISLVESIRVGVPILGSGVGGMRDLLDRFHGVYAPNNMSVANLADLIRQYATNAELYTQLRSKVAAMRFEASWSRAVGEIDHILRTN